MIDRAWYVVTTYSGLENAAKRNIENRIESMNMGDYIFQVLVPEVKSFERKKNGEMKEVITKPFPGYVFIDMIVTDETWFMVRNTPMVTGVLGSSGGGAKPVPLPEEEIQPILKMCGVAIDKKFTSQIGDMVRIISGAFAGQTGKIDEIDYDKNTVKVLVDFFGRLTPAELDFSEVKPE
ncbi:MAG: transcription termination/antitermination protein NusG [Bacilli bacterium]|jgi:transcriptional antiterminator NusG|nr:transcription termination/antitermination protein NusG [Bacilli bacterium]MDY0064151.1 transcription termination/antitermination protein NusG [Bacilli bacterium]